jgi:hypothetical protein
MNMIDILIYSGLATAALLGVLYGLPYVLVALLAIGAIHSYPQFKQWFCHSAPAPAADVPPSI